MTFVNENILSHFYFEEIHEILWAYGLQIDPIYFSGRQAIFLRLTRTTCDFTFHFTGQAGKFLFSVSNILWVRPEVTWLFLLHFVIEMYGLHCHCDHFVQGQGYWDSSQSYSFISDHAIWAFAATILGSSIPSLAECRHVFWKPCLFDIHRLYILFYIYIS